MSEIYQHRPVVFSCAGPQLTPSEKSFFRESQPLGLILFARNCENLEQIQSLISDFKNVVGRQDLLIMVDHEGGRVQRMRPPVCRAAPEMAVFGRLFAQDAERAREAVALNAQLMAAELRRFGFTVNCAPVLDLSWPQTHDVIGNRAISHAPDVVAELGQVFAEALQAGGILPVIKHLPGHGRATVDSHKELPRLLATRVELSETDFIPFKRNAHLPAAMTAHIVFEDIDPDHPATQSPTVIRDIIRGEMGFDGLLFSDDLCMEALQGSHGERAARALAAGCDVALHCNGVLADMEDVAACMDLVETAENQRLSAALSVPLAGNLLEEKGEEALQAHLQTLIEDVL